MAGCWRTIVIMRMLRKFHSVLLCAVAVAGMGSARLLAQSNPPPPPRFGRGGPGPQDGIGFLGFEAGFGNRVVTGAPYSAQVTTEHTETLGDGNQIDQKNSLTVYRDGQG